MQISRSFLNFGDRWWWIEIDDSLFIMEGGGRNFANDSFRASIGIVESVSMVSNVSMVQMWGSGSKSGGGGSGVGGRGGRNRSRRPFQESWSWLSWGWQ
jgi:hypothetical protein